MDEPEVELASGLAIAVSGDFNPAILSPAWMQFKGLISEVDHDFAVNADESRVAVSPVFSGSRYPWARVDAERDQLRVSSTEATESPERLRELVAGLLTALPETPLKGFAVVSYWHANLGEERLRKLFRQMAPASIWDERLGTLGLETLERSVSIDDAQVSLAVETSRRDGYTLFFSVEHSWKLSSAESALPVGTATAVLPELDRRWEPALKSAEGLFADTLSAA